MNRLKLVIGVVLVFAVGVLAGGIGTGFYFKERIKDFIAEGPPMDARVRIFMHEFSKDLELSDAQRVEIEKILRDAQEKIFELRRKTFPQIEALNDKSLNLIREKLDDKQKEKFNTFYNKIRRFHDRFAVRLDFQDRPFPRNIDELRDRLKLNPEQESQIREIREDFFRKRETIMKENRKDQPPDFSKIRQKMVEIDQKENKEIEKILTEEQIKEYRKYVEDRQLRRPPGPGHHEGLPEGGSPNGPPDGPPNSLHKQPPMPSRW